MRVSVVIFWVVLLGGCRVKTAPFQHSTSTKDSTARETTTNTIEKDSASYVETLTEKKQPEVTATVTLSRDDYDSIKHALEAMPKSVTRTIYLTDPKSQAVISVMLDSLNNLIFTCISAERTYNEKLTQAYKSISQHSERESTYEHKIQHLESEIRTLKKSFWVQVKQFFNNGIWFMLIIMVVFTVINFLIKRKNLLL